MNKRISICIAIAITFMISSCTTTRNVTSNNTFDNAKNTIEINLNQNGYNLNGESHDEKNELVSTGVSYSKFSGYGSAISNDYYQFDTYKFCDTVGNTMDYTVKYKVGIADERDYYVDCIQVVGCNTSKSSDYNKLCNGNYSPAKTFSNLPKDYHKTTTDTDATYTAITVTTILILIASLIPLLFI